MVQNTQNLRTNGGLIILNFSRRGSQRPIRSWKLHICRCSEIITVNSQVTGIKYEIPIMGNLTYEITSVIIFQIFLCNGLITYKYIYINGINYRKKTKLKIKMVYSGYWFLQK